MALNGICPRCGSHYVGWAMQLPQYGTCDKCGAELRITNGSHRGIKLNSLSTIKEHIMGWLNTPLLLNQRKN